MPRSSNEPALTVASRRAALDAATVAALLGCAIDGAIVADSLGIVTDLGSSAARLLDRLPSGVIGTSLADVFGPASAPAMREVLDALAKDAPGARRALSLVAACGGRSDVPLDVVVCTGETRGERVVVATAHDTSGRRLLREQLRQAQRVGVSGALAAGIAHDFNSLVTGVTGFCELLHDELAPDSTQWQHVERIRLAVANVADMARQFVRFTGRHPVRNRILDLGDVATRGHRMLERVIQSDIVVTVEAGDDVWPVYADERALDFALVSLVVRARDVLPDGGRIRIHVSNRRLRTPLVTPNRTAERGDYVQLAVTDSGPRRPVARGAAGDDQAPALSQAASRKLDDIIGAVAECGGLVTTRTIDAGTEVACLLPRFLGDDAPPPPHAATPRVAGSGETILLVEGDWAVRESVAEVLTSCGYRVLRAGSPGQALTMVETTRVGVDLLLTTVQLPGMSGRLVAERVRQRQPAARVLYMSTGEEEALSKAHDRAEPKGRGAIALQPCLAKPFTMAELAARVREVLDGPAQASTGPVAGSVR